tara:strand:- start:426 stop:713 length:288 start_codon:yes stop_codon:yes gene_type:complete
MNVDKLLIELETISTVLNDPALQTTSKNFQDADKIVKRFHELVEKIKVQRTNFLLENKSSQKLLIELSNLLESLTKECGIKLDLLNFVDQIKPRN